MRQAPLEATSDERGFGAYLRMLRGPRTERVRKSRRVRVKGHTRKTPEGKVVQVPTHERTQKERKPEKPSVRRDVVREERCAAVGCDRTAATYWQPNLGADAWYRPGHHIRTESHIPLCDAHKEQVQAGAWEAVSGEGRRWAHKLRGGTRHAKVRVQRERVAREAARPIELKVDVAEVWASFAERSYGSETNCAAMAVREAFQNARDAVRKAKGGTIMIGNLEQDKFTIADTGIGMDADTLENKFLTLGVSGKREEKGMVGGFGVAKAVILSGGGRSADTWWEIETQDIRFSQRDLGVVMEFPRAARRQGPQITWHNPTDSALYGMRQAVGEYLAWSDWGPGIEVAYQASPEGGLKEVPRLQLGRRKVFAQTELLGSKISMRQVDPDKINEERDQAGTYQQNLLRRAGIVYRLNGLAQVWEYTDAPGTWVVDIETDVRPGHEDYPFDPHRSSVKWDISAWVREQLAPLKSETLSGAGREATETVALSRAGDTWTEQAEWLRAVVPLIHQRREAYVKARKRMKGKLGPGLHISERIAMADWPHSVLEYCTTNPPQFTEDAEDAFQNLSVEATSRGTAKRLTADQMVGLLIAETYLSNVLAALGSDSWGAVYGSSDKEAIASLRTLGPWRTMGLNLEYLTEAMRDPEALDMLLFASVTHELTHILEDRHDESFSSTMGTLQRGLWPIRRQLMEDTRRMWQAWKQPKKAEAKRAVRETLPSDPAEAQLGLVLKGLRETVAFAPRPIRRYLVRLARDLADEPRGDEMVRYVAGMLLAAWSTLKQGVPVDALEDLLNRYAVEIIKALPLRETSYYREVRRVLDSLAASEGY